ncbi:MarR family winged helix-turn-helix transcriptional regulator [Aquihabitans sp. McL0605]|uniref:MarR family winged helix-turn-helix transcriptional regulator n=1 Tax=Aquihabitans sp. McL0605 TaxID=3415671 RepID=UPI003CEC3705
MASSAPPVPVQWLTDSEQRAWRSFITGSRRLLEQLDQDLKAQGVTHDDYGVLVALSESPDDRLRMAELADLSVESRSRLSHHIGRLETRGLVARQSCPDDRRGSFAVLTPEGRATIEAIAPHHVTGVREYFLDQVSSEELATIANVFARIDGALGPSADCLGEQCPGTGGPAAAE